MPSKKKAHESVLETQPVDASLPDAPKVVKEIVLPTCGHVNKQFYGPNGKLQDLACTLPPGHYGDHSAPYMKNVGEPEHDEKGRVKKTVYHQEEATAFWGDAAGKPAHEIQQGEVTQMTGFQKDLVMQVLAKNPRMTVDQAVAQAKQMPGWNEPL